MSLDKGPEGLWKACEEMERAATRVIRDQLKHFEEPTRCCYEAGVQVSTLAASRHHTRDVVLAAPFLKRSLTDVRAVWNLLMQGYTSQAASAAAALFEHALAVNVVAGNEDNASRLMESEAGDLPWSPMELSKIAAKDPPGPAIDASERDFEEAWREIYSSYKFLCKVKHPTLRSTLHDVAAAEADDGRYVVMAVPDIRPSDVAQKAMVLMISISRCFSAIQALERALECDEATESYQLYTELMTRAHSGALAAFRLATKGRQLPFTIQDEAISREYAVLRGVISTED